MYIYFYMCLYEHGFVVKTRECRLHREVLSYIFLLFLFGIIKVY